MGSCVCVCMCVSLTHRESRTHATLSAPTHAKWSCERRAAAIALTPAERYHPGPVGALLDQRLVELAAAARVNARPAVFAVVLQTGHVGAEERCELAAAAHALTLVADLVVQYVRLHLHLQRRNDAARLVCALSHTQSHGEPRSLRRRRRRLLFSRCHRAAVGRNER